MQRRSLELAVEEFNSLKNELMDIRENRIPAIEKMMIEAGAPWIEGQPFPE